MTVSPALLAAARNYNDITWEDAETDKKLSGILARSMTRLDEIAGTELVYSVGSYECDLLLERTRYALADCLPDFERDYAGELLYLHLKWEVAEHEMQACTAE